MRLIDADELIFMELRDENDQPVGIEFVPAEFIREAPTIEAVPIETYRRLLDAMRQPRRVICPDCGHIFTMVQDARMDEVENG